MELPVLGFGAVAEEGKVTFVAGDGDASVDDSIVYGAAGFAGVEAVAVTAVTADGEDLAEVMGYLFFGHLYGSEAFNTRRVDDPIPLQWIHLGESRGVHTFIVGIGYLSGAGHFAAEEGIEQGRFADTGVTGKERYAIYDVFSRFTRTICFAVWVI